MSTVITVPQYYGYVVGLSLTLLPLISWIHGLIATILRKPAGVPYPNFYATAEQAKANPKAYTFNCAQRAHANYLENAPQTMIYMLVAGLKFPRLTLATGTLWAVSRVLYLLGYVYSSRPNGNGRFLGSTFWGCQGMLWAMTALVGWDLVGRGM